MDTGRIPRRRAASFRPEIEIDGTRTRVMVEQLTAIDPQARLGKFAMLAGAPATSPHAPACCR